MWTSNAFGRKARHSRRNTLACAVSVLALLSAPALADGAPPGGPAAGAPGSGPGSGVPPLPSGAVEVAGLPWLATAAMRAGGRQRHRSDAPTLSDRKALAPIEVASIGDRELANMRGGFSFGAVDVNFGLYTATAINGAVTQSFSYASDSATANAIAHLQQVVQSGPNNTAPAAFNFQGALSLIQNTLSNTVIQHLTALSLDVAGAAGMAVHGNLSRSINNSLMLNF